MASIIAPEFPIHPKYGGEIVPGFRPIPGCDGYEINEYCVVRGKRGWELSPSPTYHVSLYVNGKVKQMKVYHLGLRAFYPLVPALETVDHIDENHHNNYIGNLQWATRPDNSSKSKAGVPQPASGAARSKAVWVLDEREGERVTRYGSLHQAAASCGNIHASGVARSALSGGRIAAQGRFFVFEEQPDLPGEEWKTSTVLDRVLQQSHKLDHKKVMVSSRGRILTTYGIKTRGWVNVQNAKDKTRYVGVNGCAFQVHQLIFMGWYNIEAPAKNAVNADGKRIVICHDDSAPHDEEGRYRNWPIDLRIDTQSENMRESHEARRVAKRAREEGEEDDGNAGGGENNDDNETTAKVQRIDDAPQATVEGCAAS